MLQHAAQLAEAGIPFIFDPGQGLPMFNGDELMQFAGQASYIALNDYEAQLFMDRTGLPAEEIARHVEALIITRGAQGSHIYTEGKRIDIPRAKADRVVDPTGCGILNGKDWEETGRIASLMGAIKIAHPGTQNHIVSRDELNQRYQASFELA